MPTKNPTALETGKEILTAEFEYIAGSAGQANEDRARVASFYLIAVGSLVAALLSTQLLESGNALKTLSILFSGLFLVLTLLGTLTVTQLARLRAAWYESMIALNQIKEYVISKDRDLARAFRWRTSSLPPLHNVSSVSYQQTLEVAMLSALTFGASIYFAQLALGYDCPACNWAYTAAGALLAFFTQLYLYKRVLLSAQKEKTKHAA